ncbi:MAG: NADH-quinone oxidoreductase subunit J family protein [Nitrososphaerales archaeon]
MIEEDIAFSALAGLTIGAAIVSLEARQVVYGAISLAFSFLGVAGLFILLNATFVALFQIIVYVGAIAVLILFTVMLVTKDVEKEAVREPIRPFAILIAVAVAVIVSVVAAFSNFTSTYATSSNLSVADIGGYLAGPYAFALEILALVLGASILGALTLAKLEKE